MILLDEYPKKWDMYTARDKKAEKMFFSDTMLHVKKDSKARVT